MAKEIEEKFLLREAGNEYLEPLFYQYFKSIEKLRSHASAIGIQIAQGYLSLALGINVARELKVEYDFEPAEARVRHEGENFIFNLKGKGSLTRNETPSATLEEKLFNELWLNTEGARVYKTRVKQPYSLPSGIYVVEFDVYRDRDLVIAEVEVPTEDLARLVREIKPLGKNVTNDSRYKNKNLAK